MPKGALPNLRCNVCACVYVVVRVHVHVRVRMRVRVCEYACSSICACVKVC